MIPEFDFWCQKVLPLVYDDSLSYYEVLCKVVDKLNQCISSSNSTSEALNKFIAWANANAVTHNQMSSEYALDREGNFTGTIGGLPYYIVQSNRDSLQAVIGQIAHGQVGAIINGGFFTDSGIKDSYNGGIF